MNLQSEPSNSIKATFETSVYLNFVSRDEKPSPLERIGNINKYSTWTFKLSNLLLEAT